MNELTTNEIIALQAWKIISIEESTITGAGLINRVVLIKSSSGLFVLKSYSSFTKDEIRGIHAIMHFANKNGIPTALPLLTADGNEILEIGGKVYCLYNAIAGSHVKSEQLSTQQVYDLGFMLAKIHESLFAFTNKDVKKYQIDLDWQRSLDRIEAITEIIQNKTDFDELDEYALNHIKIQKIWLKKYANESTKEITEFKCQVVHGDFQLENILFNGDVGITAVLDWDLAYYAPKELDIIRSLHYLFNFSPVGSSIFIDGYRDRNSFDMNHLIKMSRYYTIQQANDLWMFSEAYIRGNNKVRKRFNKNGFISVETPLKIMYDDPAIKAYL